MRIYVHICTCTIYLTNIHISFDVQNISIQFPIRCQNLYETAGKGYETPCIIEDFREKTRNQKKTLDRFIDLK